MFRRCYGGKPVSASLCRVSLLLQHLHNTESVCKIFVCFAIWACLKVPHPESYAIAQAHF